MSVWSQIRIHTDVRSSANKRVEAGYMPTFHVHCHDSYDVIATMGTWGEHVDHRTCDAGLFIRRSVRYQWSLIS